jgi:O-antigen/teichoic acid export membrane protein
MSRYFVSAIEQALWSLMNLGVNLVLIRLCAPADYGAFAFWSAIGFVLSSIQNALTVCHLQVLPPGEGTDPARLSVERLMHAVTAVFLVVAAAGALAGGLWLQQAGSALGAPAACLFIPGFLLQQYIRALAFSRGRPTTAAFQTGAVTASAALFLALAINTSTSLSADQVLICMGAAYGLVGVAGAARALTGQMGGLHWRDLASYRRFAAQSGWIFLGVTTTELQVRFYAFLVAGWYGAATLASLSATQLLLRPVPLLATSWSMVARADLARQREAAHWGAFTRLVGVALVGGLFIAAAWTVLLHQVWGLASAKVFGGKYGDDAWMIWLWGISAALSFGQVVVSAGLQALKAFKALALANAAASLVATVAVVLIARLYGYGGAIAGTATGQGFEFAVMGVLLITILAARRRA